jgi:hypothetical protein
VSVRVKKKALSGCFFAPTPERERQREREREREGGREGERDIGVFVERKSEREREVLMCSFVRERVL